MIKKTIAYLWNIITNIGKKPNISYYECIALFYFALWIRKDIEVTLWKQKYTFPLDPNALSWIREIWTLWAYSKLAGCKKVLDLWWFLWESGLRLANHNNEVMIYEANANNFEYIKKNISWHKNISAHYGAVVWDQSLKEISFWSSGFDLWGKVSSNWTTVPALFIGDIDKGCDWLKMDIEWEEYRVLSYYMSKNNRNYQKWYIEFHETRSQKNIQIITNFSKFLTDKWYSIKWYKANNNHIDTIDNVLSEDIWILYFQSWI